MIKEKSKKKKEKKLTLAQEITAYVKTAGISFLVAAIISTMLSYSARNSMIKNFYMAKEKRALLEQKVAKQIVANADFTATLYDKSYAVMIQVGNLYEAAGDLPKAEYAYYLATQKAPSNKYLSYLKLCTVLIEQNKIDDVIDILSDVTDSNNLSLIRFKTRTYIILGDKYFSENKFLKAADAYEKANYYYSKLSKRDKVVQESIRKRLIKAYLETASVIIKNGYNSDGARFLKKALYYDPNNLKIQYRLAIVYADLDPITSVEYFEPLIAKIPQEIDRDIFSNVLIKAANIMDIQGNSIKAKYYRYKIHSLDVYSRNKVVYKEDIDVIMNSFTIKKVLFTYRLKSSYTIKNISSQDINKLSIQFILRYGDEEKDQITLKNYISKKNPLYSNGGETNNVDITFGKNIFTKQELENYYIDIYLFKDANYKTLVGTYKVPLKNPYSSKTLVSPHL